MWRIFTSLLILSIVSCKDESKEDLDDIHLGKGYVDNPESDSTGVPPQKTTFEFIVGEDTLSKSNSKELVKEQD